MSLIVSAEGGAGFEPISEGLHQAVCVGVVDLGQQYSEMYAKLQPKVMILWEVVDETFEQDGQEVPRSISKEFTASFNEKSTLRKALKSWRGREFTEAELAEFDLRNILGKGCQLQLIHKVAGNNKTYANVEGIVSWPKGQAIPKPHSDIIAFDLDEPDYEDKLNLLPEWIQKKIKESETYKCLSGQVSEEWVGEAPPEGE